MLISRNSCAAVKEWPPISKKSSLTPIGAHTQHGTEHVSEPGFDLVHGLGLRASIRWHFRFWKSPAVQLAIGVQGERVQEYESGRNHVFGKPLPKEAAQCGDVRQIAALRDQISDDPAVSGRAGLENGDSVANGRMPHTHRANLFRLNAVTPQFDLVVIAPQTFDISVAPISRQIARSYKDALPVVCQMGRPQIARPSKRDCIGSQWPIHPRRCTVRRERQLELAPYAHPEYRFACWR